MVGDEGWGFFLAAARAPDIRASKAEGRVDIAMELGLKEEKGLRMGKKEQSWVGKRDKERAWRGRSGQHERSECINGRKAVKSRSEANQKWREYLL